MRVLIQRVTEARVTVEGRETGTIGPGLLVLVCAMAGDDEDAATRMAGRVARLRIFRDEAGRMNRSVQDAGGAVLVVSHDLPLLRRMHRRVLVLDHGRLVDDISPQDLAE